MSASVRSTAFDAPLQGAARTLLARFLWPLGWLIMAVATLVAALVIVPLGLIRGPESAWFVPVVWSRLLLWLAGSKVSVSGAENLPLDGPAVIVSNHSSHLDGPALALAFPRPIVFVAKKELARIPVFGQALRGIGSVIVDRGRSEKARRQMKKALDQIRAGSWVVIFAEGTRSRDGRLRAFKKGGFHLAIDAQVPIVPVAIRGAFAVLPKGAIHVRRPGTVEVVVGEPISVAGLTKKDLPELLERTHDTVGALLRESESRENPTAV